MCNVTIFRSAGAGLYVLGLLVGGVMFCVIGAQYNETAPDNTDLKTYFWVYAIAMVLAAIGLVLDNGNRFCGEEEFKGVDYFGGLFQVVSVFAWGALGVGIAHYYEDALFAAPTSGEERGSLAYLSGVAAILYGFGSLFTLKKLLCCEGFSCDMASIFNIVNMVLCILLIVFWFVFADKLEEDPAAEAGDDDRRTFAYLLGVVYILMGLMGSLLIVDVCGSKPKPKPVYGGDGGYNDGYDNQDGGYGNQGGNYGDDTTTGYGGNQRPSY